MILINLLPHREVARKRTEDYVQIAQDQGAKLVAGGKRPAGLDKGFYYEPTLFTDVDNKSRLAQEEVFGPIGAVIGFFCIQALNLVRIISLFYMGQWSQVAFDWFHLYLWQALIVLDALAVWLIWLRYLPKAPRRPPPPSPARCGRAGAGRRGRSGSG